MKNFNGHKLKDLMVADHSTAAILSKKLSLSRCSLHFAANGYRPEPYIIEKLCAYFNVPLTYFDDGKENPKTIELQKLIKDSNKKLVVLSAESNVSTMVLRMILNSNTFEPSEKKASNIKRAILKEDVPKQLTSLDIKLKKFADRDFDGDIETAKEFILRTYFVNNPIE